MPRVSDKLRIRMSTETLQSKRCRVSRCQCSATIFRVVAYGAIIGTEALGARRCGQADPYDEPRARVVSWPPLQPTRLRRERKSVVVSPAAPAMYQGGANATHDWHRYPPNFRGGGVVGAGRIDMTRTALEGFGNGLLASDEVVVETTANSMGCRASRRRSWRG